VIIKNDPPVLLGMFAALSNLIRDAGGALTITGESSVDGAAELIH
jgi:hypothetical protein